MTKATRAPKLSAYPTAVGISVVGLLTAAVGVLIQYLTLPDDFPTVPPGPIVLIAAAAFVAVGFRWWWSPLVGLGVALMIAIGGVLNGGVADNVSDSAGPASGAGLMLIGLAVAIAAGVLAISQRRTAPTIVRNHS